MFYNPTRLMSFFADLPLDLFRVLMVLAVVLSMTLLALAGGIVRNWLGIFQSERKPWAFDIVLALIVGAGWFVLKSMISNLTGIQVSTFEQEHTVLLVLSSALLGRSVLKKSFQEMRGMDSCIYACLLVGSVYAYGYWRAFDLLPASSDPGVLTVLTDGLRESGYLRLQLAEWNNNIANYPSGIMLLSWAFANPLIPTISLYHLWPHINIALMSFLAWDICSRHLKLGRKDYLLGLVVVLLARVLIGNFDVSKIWRDYQGYSKRSGGALLMLWFAFVFDMTRDRLGSKAAAWSLVLGLWGLALLPLINPINAYLSAACGVTGLIACVLSKNLTAKSILWASAGALLVIGAALVQDPLVMLTTGQNGPSCKFFSSTASFCNWGELERAQAEKVALKVDVKEVGRDWKAYLPHFLRPEESYFYQRDLAVFYKEEVVLGVLPVIACLGLVCLFVHRRMLGKRWIGVTLFLVSTYAVALTFAYGQTYLLTKVVGADRAWLMPGYTNISFVNLWTVVFYLIVVGAIALCSLRVKQSQQRPVMLVLLVIAILFSFRNAQAAYQGSRSMNLRYGSDSPRLASIVHEIDLVVEDRATIYLPGDAMQVGPELWSFPQEMSVLQMFYLGRPYLLGYSGFWPLGAPTVKEHYAYLCEAEDPCGYFRTLGVDWIFDVSKVPSHLCGMPISLYAQRTGCFEPAAFVETSGSRIKAAGYRVLGSKSN